MGISKVFGHPPKLMARHVARGCQSIMQYISTQPVKSGVMDCWLLANVNQTEPFFSLNLFDISQLKGNFIALYVPTDISLLCDYNGPCHLCSRGNEVTLTSLNGFTVRPVIIRLNRQSSPTGCHSRSNDPLRSQNMPLYKSSSKYCTISSWMCLFYTVCLHHVPRHINRWRLTTGKRRGGDLRLLFTRKTPQFTCVRFFGCPSVYHIVMDLLKGWVGR